MLEGHYLSIIPRHWYLVMIASSESGQMVSSQHTLVECVIARSSHIVMACNLICLIHMFFWCLCGVALWNASCNSQQDYCGHHSNRFQNADFVVCSVTKGTVYNMISNFLVILPWTNELSVALSVLSSVAGCGCNIWVRIYLNVMANCALGDIPAVYASAEEATMWRSVLNSINIAPFTNVEDLLLLFSWRYTATLLQACGSTS